MYDKRTYRDIEILGDASLYELAEAIIYSFEFEFDHCFGFYGNLGKKYFDSEEQYELFADVGEESNAGSVKKTKVCEVFTELKKKMLFLFDYGDNWQFEVELRGFGEKTKEKPYPVILKINGEPPFQYPVFDDEYADYDYEEEVLLDKLKKALEEEAKS